MGKSLSNNERQARLYARCGPPIRAFVEPELRRRIEAWTRQHRRPVAELIRAATESYLGLLAADGSAEPSAPALQDCSQAGSLVEQHCALLARLLVARELAREPRLASHPGSAALLQDAAFHFACLATALACNRPALFAEHLVWRRSLQAAHRLQDADLAFRLECSAELLRAHLPEASGQLAAWFLTQLRLDLAAAPGTPATALPRPPASALMQCFSQSLLRGDGATAASLVQQAVAAGMDVATLCREVFEPSQQAIGRAWQAAEISVAQEHYATAVTTRLLAQLCGRAPRQAAAGRTAVAACIAGERHELGLRMVAELLELDGWQCYCTGADTPVASVLDTVLQRRPRLLLLSATLVPGVPDISRLIRQLRQQPECASLRIVVGGQPFQRHAGLWREVGADGMAADAAGTVTLANQLLVASVVADAVSA